MNLLNIIGIQDASAQNVPTVPAVNQTTTQVATPATSTPTHPQGAGYMSMIWMLAAFIIIFYFLLIRPQSKRAKQQRQLIDSLTKGDEVVTTAGIVGKISKITDEFVILSIAEGVDITFQKAAIVSVLPKGTIKAV